MDIFINGDGSMQFVHDDDLAEALSGGVTVTRRASHVEPDEQGRWMVDLSPVGGPLVGPFSRRDAALAWEVEWLTQQFEQEALTCRT